MSLKYRDLPPACSIPETPAFDDGVDCICYNGSNLTATDFNLYDNILKLTVNKMKQIVE